MSNHRSPFTVHSVMLCLLAAGMMAGANAAGAAPQQMKITFGGYGNATPRETLASFPVLLVW